MLGKRDSLSNASAPSGVLFALVGAEAGVTS